MNAIQPSRPPNRPVEPRQVSTAKKTGKQRRLSRHPYRGMVIETTTKLAVNTVISAAALLSLVHLVPYLWSQQEKWQEIHTEVKQTQRQVATLRQNFNRYFDPHQAKTIMKEQSNRIEPGQSQVILLNQSPRKSELHR